MTETTKKLRIGRDKNARISFKGRSNCITANQIKHLTLEMLFFISNLNNSSNSKRWGIWFLRAREPVTTNKLLQPSFSLRSSSIKLFLASLRRRYLGFIKSSRRSQEEVRINKDDAWLIGIKWMNETYIKLKILKKLTLQRIIFRFERT